MYQLLDFNIDYLALHKEPVYLVGTGIEAVKAFKRIFVRSIQLGENFQLAGVYSLDQTWIGKIYCSAIVHNLTDGEKPKGIYLVADNDYKEARRMMDLLIESGIEQIIVTLPTLQFPMEIERFKENRELFLCNQDKIQYVYDRLEDNKSKKIWENILRARSDQAADHALLYQDAWNLSIETGSRQYFPVGEIFQQLGKEGVFIDGGALSGSSSIKFAQWCKNHYDKIYAFEPDIRYHDLLETNIRCHYTERVEIMDVGLYDRTGMAAFSPEPIGSSIVGQGKGIVPVVTIDDLFLKKNENITYIKMDIEGSECKALDGAKKIISRDHPKLAICIYHGKEDIFQVPYKIVKELGYTRFFIRHYSDTIGESVIYAEK